METPTAVPTRSSARWQWIGLAALLAAAGAVAWYYRLPARVQTLLKAALDWVATLGAWGPIIYLLLYITSCVVLLPASILTLGAGAVFGVVKGSILVNIGATLGASAAFLVGRHLARDWVSQRIAGHPGFAAIDKAVADEGWRIVLLTRLSPVFPFFLLNYAYGLTRVSFRHFFFATWIGIIPGSTLFVYLGSLANPDGARASALEWTFKIAGLIATILVTLYITRIARRALAKRVGPVETARSARGA